jgi:CRISPR/Cas system-associated exonuclease Cas4 (RecB family)
MQYKSLDEVLCSWLDKKDIKRDSEHHNDCWYASELGLCKRKSFFRRLKIPVSQPKEYRIRFLAEEGYQGHNWREQAAKEMGVVVDSEGSLVDPETGYRGRFDLLLKLDELEVDDIKTQRPEAFFRRAKKPEGERIEWHQKLQLASYVYFLRKLRNLKTLRRARIHYYDRGGGCREEYVFHFGPKMFNEVTSELRLLNQYWEAHRFPPKDKKHIWQCRYCEWSSVCKHVEINQLTTKDTIKHYGQSKNKTKENSNN